MASLPLPVYCDCVGLPSIEGYVSTIFARIFIVSIKCDASSMVTVAVVPAKMYLAT